MNSLGVEVVLIIFLGYFFFFFFFFFAFSIHAYFQRTNSLTVLSDVARPDKISGADINAICQEVSYTDNTMCMGEGTLYK